MRWHSAQMYLFMKTHGLAVPATTALWWVSRQVSAQSCVINAFLELTEVVTAGPCVDCVRHPPDSPGEAEGVDACIEHFSEQRRLVQHVNESVLLGTRK